MTISQSGRAVWILRAAITGVGVAVLFTSGSTAVPLKADGTTVSVIASGLNDPRGLAFGPDKRLYIAEAGTGGAMSTAGLCDQMPTPVGPVLGGSTARIMVLEPGSASPTVLAAALPSAEASPLIGGDRQGIADVTFIGDQLLALVAGAGCSHGHADANNAILQIDREGNAAVLADLSVWLLANPGTKGLETPRNPDYEPDGTWYSLMFGNGRLYAVEPNHGLLVSVNPATGSISLINDLFATFGDHTYTTLAADRGDLYVGTLGRIAFLPGVFPPALDLAASFEAGVYRLSPNGTAVQVVDGLHAVLGLAFDDHHRLYVLQSPIFVPGTGSLVRVEADGTIQTVVSNLVFPSGLTRGADGAFYVSECGYHCQPGDGRILRVAVE